MNIAVIPTQGGSKRVPRKKGIVISVHYIPVHLHPFYRKTFHASLCLCSVAEAAYEQVISMQMLTGMTDYNVDYVLNTIISD